MDPKLINQKVAVPKGAIVAPIQIKGAASDIHVERHSKKMEVNMGDCGIDLFPFGIARIEYVDSKAKGLFGVAKPWPIIYVSTQVHMTICAGAFIFITSRSSTALLVPSAEFLDGKIDAGYTGEMLVRFKCHPSMLDETLAFIDEAIKAKKALAQAVPMQFCYPQFFLITDGNILVPPGMGRGDKGFGSTDELPNNN